MRRFALAVGNSTVKLGVFDGQSLQAQRQWPHAELEAADAVRVALADAGVQAGSLVGVCSVVPLLAARIAEALAALGADTEIVDVLRGPLPLRYRTPGTLGADRYCVAVAARAMFGAPVLVVDCGTALTINVVDTEGYFAGGSIAPGIGTAFRVMHEGTAQLPMLDVADAPLVGGDTEESMRSGVLHLYRHGVAGMLHAMKRQTGLHTPVVLTGGDAALLAEGGVEHTACDANILLRGIIFYLLFVRGE
ncbi:MAG: type III pantothenate kinase [Bacteroidia bacterium]|nr:type III pantothenate kinase [Bacteroidia bacterium]